MKIITIPRKKTMLTTFDNPYDPFDEFDAWFSFDQDSDYCCCSYLARIGNFSDSLTDEENDLEQERAIDEIIRVNPLNIYKKVTKIIDDEVQVLDD